MGAHRRCSSSRAGRTWTSSATLRTTSSPSSYLVMGAQRHIERGVAQYVGHKLSPHATYMRPTDPRTGTSVNTQKSEICASAGCTLTVRGAKHRRALHTHVRVRYV